jgi:hypothetical protein
MDVDMPFDPAMADMDLDMNFDIGGDMHFVDNDLGAALSDLHMGDDAAKTPRAKKRVCAIWLNFIEDHGVLTYPIASRRLG